MREGLTRFLTDESGATASEIVFIAVLGAVGLVVLMLATLGSAPPV